MARNNNQHPNMVLSEINNKLDSMKINEDQSEQSIAVHMGTTNGPANHSQARKTGNGRRKKQWKKLDMASGQTMPLHREEPSATGRKVYNGPLRRPFHLFPRLPIELRAKIWGYASLHPRIIEIERGPKVRDGYELIGPPCAGDEYRCRVCPASRRPPSILHVSSEARDEAMKHYKVRTFDTRTPKNTERYIYYNQNCDIIYFGEDSCISTLLFTFARVPREPIPRVAITLSCKAKCSCDYDDPVYGADTDIRTMKALHGLFPPFIRESDMKRWPGCLGLEEVYWVVPSNLWRREQGTTDSNVGMRQATTNGLTKGQRSWKKSLLWDMGYVERGLWKSGEVNMWEDKKPKFRFVSLAPHPKYDGLTTTLYDGLGCSSPFIKVLAKKDFEFVKQVERTTSCEIVITPQTYPNEDPREIGFIGTKESIMESKKLVLEKLAISRSEQIYVYRVSDAWEEAWNEIRLVVPGQL